MKILKMQQRSPEWFDARKGHITGTGLKKVIGRKDSQESYFYEILAERLAISDGSEAESAMDRGVRLENEALEAFEKKTGNIVESVGFIESSENQGIGCSPDGLIRKGKKYTGSIEVKCLNSGNHLRAWIEDKIPDEYMPQIIQAFIVNNDLQTMWSVFYDPRIKQHPLHIIKTERKEIAETIKEYKEAEEKFLERIDEALSKIVKI